VPWLTRWPVTREAAVVVEAGERDLLVVQFHNHVPLARELARDAEVRWGGPSTVETLIDELRRRGGDQQRVGLIGDVPFPIRDALAAAVGAPVDLSAAYVRERLLKSAEELAHLRHGALLSDAALHALATGLVPGRTDHELIDRIERAYVPHGGTTHIHYLAITPMTDPQRCVPAQLPVGATVERGSVVLTELSAAFRGYAGQVLRTLAVGEPLSGVHRDLHEVAQEVFDRIVAVLADGVTTDEILAAAQGVADAGYALCDDLLHGFGGGYLPPVIGRLGEPTPSFTVRSAMTLVVQPNVTTPDGRAGVQTGELVAITDRGVERLHTAPPGPIELAVEGTAVGIRVRPPVASEDVT
jgi:Xaa-Pro dipeptidase